MAREKGGLGEGVYVGNKNEINLKKKITSMYQPHIQANDVLNKLCLKEPTFSVEQIFSLTKSFIELIFKLLVF